MKNIHELLKELGYEVPADKKEEFDRAVAENYKTIAEHEKLKTKHDALDESLSEAKKQLKSFEGVDVNELNSKITELTNLLAAKETEYTQKIADMEFDTALESAITASGAKNPKAVRALLDLDALKASKNRDGDISNALKQCKTDNDYLFKSDEPFHNPTGPVNTGGSGADPLAAVRAAMGLKTEK